MDYEKIKQKARLKAEDMHERWLVEHFNGEEEDTHHPDHPRYTEDSKEDMEDDYAGDLKEKLFRGGLLPTELEDELAFLIFKALRDKTYEEWRDPAKLLEAPRPSQAVAKIVRFSAKIDDYLADKKARKASISVNTLDGIRATLLRFVDVMGDMELHSISYEDCTAFRDQLVKMPKNRNKLAKYKNKTAAELISLDLPESECLSTKTISDDLSTLKGYFNWLSENAKTIPSNPFKGVAIEVRSDSYTSLTVEDLQKLFNSPLFISGSDYQSRSGRRSRWWLIVLAAFTGARIGELVQLMVSDIVKKDGVWCFSLLDEEQEKELKTDAARRIFPIHPQLLALGFLEYHSELVRQGADRILWGIPLGSRKAGQQASGWYLEHYRDLYLPEFKEERKVFHSFRHTFIQESISKEGHDLLKLQAIVGHETSKQLGATLNYAGNLSETYTGQQLLKQVSLVTYDGLDLSHLDWRVIRKP